MSAPGKGPFCPECSKPATGNFCHSCGAKLGGRFCNQCGSQVAGSAGFCNQCGNKLAGGGSGHRAAAVATVGGANLPWWIAGAAMFVVIIIVGVSMVRPAGPVAPTGPATGASIGGAPPDLSAMTPREAADRLYSRVMTAAEQGDSMQAQQFMPMAIAAYERAMPLDHDGLFHLSLLQRTAGDLETALRTAESILDQDPDYVLGLLAAAQAATELGLEDDAGAYYQHLVDVYDAQVARALPEYEMHSPIMRSARSDAEAFLGR